MAIALGGERMRLPTIQPEGPPLVPPSPYSVAPIGIDLVAAATKTRKLRRGRARLATATTFAAGVLVGALAMDGVREGWLLRGAGTAVARARVTATSISVRLGAAPPVQAPRAAAAPPAPVPAPAPPPPPVPGAVANAAAAAPASTTVAVDSLPVAHPPVRSLHAAHAKAAPKMPAAPAPAAPAAAPASPSPKAADDSLMRAIGAAAH